MLGTAETIAPAHCGRRGAKDKTAAALAALPERARASLPVEHPATSPMAALQELSLEQLRLHCRKTLGGSAPAHLPKHLLVRLLAYRLQAQAEGDLDRATARAL